VIVYLDSSVLARSYLHDEDGHREAVALLDDPDIGRVTGSWTRIEVSGALIRAARASRLDADAQGLLASLDADLDTGGRVTELTVSQADVEKRALELMRRHALRTLDTWHLALASLSVPALAAPAKEEMGFATRDDDQATVAEALGFTRV
jgi:uncharacterized protein